MEEWLSLLRLEEYLSALKQQNYSTVQQVTQIQWEDLEDVGITKLGHQKKVRIFLVTFIYYYYYFIQIKFLFNINSKFFKVLIES